MSNFLKKYEIWIFLVLAPILNTLFVYATTKGLIPDFAYSHGRFYLLLFLLIFIVKFTRGINGIKDMFVPMLKWKINPLWYLFSLVFALSIAAITLIIKGIYNNESDLIGLFVWDIPSFRGAFTLLTWAFVGEVVWVSYSVRELSKTKSFFTASQIVGFFWTLWWIPVVYLNVSVIKDLPLLALLLNMLGAAGMCTVVYLKTKSGICVWVLQYMLNMSLILLPVSPTRGGATTYTVFAIIYFIVMLILMYFIKPKEKQQLAA